MGREVKTHDTAINI